MGRLARPYRQEWRMYHHKLRADCNANSCQVRFLADPSGKFTEALDLSFDSASVFGNNRSKRYALVVENGKVKDSFVEPDNIGVNGKALIFIVSKSY